MAWSNRKRNYVIKIQQECEHNENHNYSDEDIYRAACSLNLCTVSVSQIIDYRDIVVLNQEYDAILNNLNLEYIQKDDALLNCIRQIMDTITFFKINEGNKAMVEERYKEKVKSAIWASVPNFGVIFATPEPAVIATQMAINLGISYMHYRKNIANYKREYTENQWALQRAAIEQFNNLRRELFDAAWKMSDKYKIPDNYRLTEKQITIYNQIIIDEDDLRRYERLDRIKDQYEAYPPFWYYIANACASIYLNNNEDEYLKLACQYYDKYFEKIDEKDLLRENIIAASAALEYFELEQDDDKRKKLLEYAEKSARNTNDILQICAIDYLKLRDADTAARLMRYLVNENHNTMTNIQLLSLLYGALYISAKKDNNEKKVSGYKLKYESLLGRISKIDDCDSLIEFPENDSDVEVVFNKFVSNQKGILISRAKLVLEKYKQKYEIEFNKIYSCPSKWGWSDYMYLDKETGSRITSGKKELASHRKLEDYISVLADIYIGGEICHKLSEFYEGLLRIQIIGDIETNKSKIEDNIKSARDNIEDIQRKLEEDKFDVNDYEKLQSMNFSYFVNDFLAEVKANIEEDISDYSDISLLVEIDAALLDFCLREQIEYPTIHQARSNGTKSTYHQQQFEFAHCSSPNEIRASKKRRLRKELYKLNQHNADYSIQIINNTKPYADRYSKYKKEYQYILNQADDISLIAVIVFDKKKKMPVQALGLTNIGMIFKRSLHPTPIFWAYDEIEINYDEINNELYLYKRNSNSKNEEINLGDAIKEKDMKMILQTLQIDADKYVPFEKEALWGYLEANMEYLEKIDENWIEEEYQKKSFLNIKTKVNSEDHLDVKSIGLGPKVNDTQFKVQMYLTTKNCRIVNKESKRIAFGSRQQILKPLVDKVEQIKEENNSQHK